MARLIDANAPKDRIRQEPTDGMYTAETLEAIDEVPTVDAAPVVHGRWKAHKPDCRGYTAGFICSNCGETIYTDYSMKECIYNFCPNCGAKMDGV